jgi:hypothetical protein
MSKFNELTLEKESIINWGGYNTPSLKDVTVTPLVGTELLGPEDRNNTLSIYNEWLIASRYLLREYNIWFKVKIYVDKELVNNSLLSFLEKDSVNDSITTFFYYEQAYLYYILRQFEIYNQIPHFNPTSYIIDFTSYDHIYREICEDLLYILLNLLLANKIIGNKNLEQSLDNKDKFYLILSSIIENHYTEYHDAYKNLEHLRWYSINNRLSYKDIEVLYAYIKKNP